MADLVSSARRLTPVPPDAAAAFAAAGDALVAAVDRSLASHADAAVLCGGLPAPVLALNHRNHHALMAMVLRFNAYGVLARTLPWVYRTYGVRGCDPDYFRATRAAFSRAIAEELPAPLAAPVLNVYAWMDTTHELVRAEADRPEPPATLDPARAHLSARFREALLGGDTDAACALMAEQVGEGHGLAGFYLGVLDPSMEEIGRRWEIGDLTVADEHLATSVAARVMSATFAALPRRAPVHGRAIVTTAPGERHELGARILADLLDRDGWEVLFLGADTPISEIVRFARRQRPVFVAISVALPANVVAAADLVAAMHADPVLGDLRVMAGGQAFRRHAELVASIGCDGYASDAAAAVELARSWGTRP